MWFRKKNLNEQLEQARAILEGKTKVIVFTGSGASAPSGLPTFSGPKALVDWGIQKFGSDRTWRSRLWEMVFDDYWEVKPNPAHDAIAAYVEKNGAVHVTSNIDGLLPGIELCGTAKKAYCMDCLVEYETCDMRDEWLRQRSDLICECGGIIRPDVVFIGEVFGLKTWDAYYKALIDFDALIVIGASALIGTWGPAVSAANELGIPIIAINTKRSPWDREATVLIKGDAAILTPRLLG